MIPFASQRGAGQDLATHLMNALDNEHQEVAQVRGAVAKDLHGAFAEWELQAAALTRCRNYLYSLSVNPDPAQGQLSRDQYFDYIDRVENQLGLMGQPRAVVFHVKNGREHCHVIWSRIDTDKGKAVQLAFDHDKLMMVTRGFARDHGLTLPNGYTKDRQNGKAPQLTLYEKAQQDQTGISKQERMALITQLWRSRDSAASFVRALEANGYVLASGKRPYVLVDIYGQTNALAKMIDDRQVRTKDIRAFLGEAFTPENLPSIEEAKKLAAQHRKAIEEFEKARAAQDKLDALKRDQLSRRQQLTAAITAMKRRHHEERLVLATTQKAERAAQTAGFRAQMQAIRLKRYRSRPTGLAAFLGRITGVALIVKKIDRYRDSLRLKAHLAERQELRGAQAGVQQSLAQRQRAQANDLDRQRRALDLIERRELRSLDTKALAAQRTRWNARHGHMPPFKAHEPEDLVHEKTSDRGPAKGSARYRSRMAQELFETARTIGTRRPSFNVLVEFGKAAEGRSDDGKGGRGSDDAALIPKTAAKDDAIEKETRSGKGHDKQPKNTPRPSRNKNKDFDNGL